VQTDPFGASGRHLLSKWLICASTSNDDARQKIVHTQLQDVAGSMSLLVLIRKAANKANKDNNVLQLILCT
jgi:hypothetical protein